MQLLVSSITRPRGKFWIARSFRLPQVLSDKGMLMMAFLFWICPGEDGQRGRLVVDVSTASRGWTFFLTALCLRKLRRSTSL